MAVFNCRATSRLSSLVVYLQVDNKLLTIDLVQFLTFTVVSWVIYVLFSGKRLVGMFSI